MGQLGSSEMAVNFFCGVSVAREDAMCSSCTLSSQPLLNMVVGNLTFIFLEHSDYLVLQFAAMTIYLLLVSLSPALFWQGTKKSYLLRLLSLASYLPCFSALH